MQLVNLLIFFKSLNFPFSPFLVGNLWDVTDKDMDAMTEHILESATTSNSVTDLLDLIQQARRLAILFEINF